MPHAVDERVTPALVAAIAEQVAEHRRIIWRTGNEYMAVKIDELYPDWRPQGVKHHVIKVVCAALKAAGYPENPPPESVFEAAYDEAQEQFSRGVGEP